MRSWNRSLVVAVVLAGVIAASAPVSGWSADDDPEVKALLAEASTQANVDSTTSPRVRSEPGPQVRSRAAKPAPLLDDTPRMRDTVLAAGGGLLVVVLAALGLTITFRSLRADLRGRKHRYRRRIRREPRSA